MTGFSDLDTTLERLYSVYARYPLARHTHFCAHCATPDDIAKVRSKPLRELTVDDLELYAWKGLSTWGDLTEFKHFLPRLLELAVREEEFGSLHAWSLLNKVGVRWADWPHDEREAIRGFIDAWWHATLEEFPHRLNVLEVLEIIALLEIGIGSYLTDWGQAATESAALHLAWLVHEFTHHSASSGQWYTTLEAGSPGPSPHEYLKSRSSPHPLLRSLPTSPKREKSWNSGPTTRPLPGHRKPAQNPRIEGACTIDLAPDSVPSSASELQERG